MNDTIDRQASPEQRNRPWLLVASATTDKVFGMAADLERRFPGEKIVLLTEQYRGGDLMNVDRFDSVWYYRSVWSTPSLLLGAWRRRLAGVALYERSGRGEDAKLWALAYLFPCRQALVYTPEGVEARHLSWKTWLWHFRWFVAILFASTGDQAIRSLLRAVGNFALTVVLGPITLVYLVVFMLIVNVRAELGKRRR